MTSLLLAVLGVRILQPRRIAPFDPICVAPPVLASDAQLPRLVVFDLDHTLWTPELYPLRHLPGYDAASPPVPVAGEDVWLLDGAEAVLHELATHERWQEVRVAAASRTNKGNWARHLLGEFCVPGCDDRRLNELIPLQEIFPGSKLTHFERLRESTGIPYGDMIFFDDSASGRYGNCEPVAGLGVLSVHCPGGSDRRAVVERARGLQLGEGVGVAARPRAARRRRCRARRRRGARRRRRQILRRQALRLRAAGRRVARRLLPRQRCGGGRAAAPRRRGDGAARQGPPRARSANRSRRAAAQEPLLKLARRCR